MQCDNGENGDNGDLQTETAWGGDTAGGGAAWWYYYDPDIGGEQTIWAGQDHDAGTVEVVDGTIHITLLNGWELQDDSESVKIQGYNEIPDSRPPAGSFLLPELLFFKPISSKTLPYNPKFVFCFRRINLNVLIKA